MKKIKVPGVAFFLTAVALLATVAAFILFFSTYRVGGYKIDRWTVTCSVLSLWFLACICASMFFEGDKPFVRDIFLVLTVFLLTFGVTKFIHPCLTPIGFAFAAGDLNMGDSALNRVIAIRSVITAVFYVIAIVCTILACFFSARWKGGEQEVIEEEEV